MDKRGKLLCSVGVSLVDGLEFDYWLDTTRLIITKRNFIENFTPKVLKPFLDFYIDEIIGKLENADTEKTRSLVPNCDEIFVVMQEWIKAKEGESGGGIVLGVSSEIKHGYWLEAFYLNEFPKKAVQMIYLTRQIKGKRGIRPSFRLPDRSVRLPKVEPYIP